MSLKGHTIAVPTSEVAGVSVRTALQSSASTCCLHHEGPVLFLHSFRRKQFDWVPVDHAIDFSDEASAQQWMEYVQQVLDTQTDRPLHLFVVINPYGGNQRADDVWQEVVKPIFERAHITCDAFRTGYRDHAVELLKNMPISQFQGYDGVVAVGGDGLFQECIRGLLALRIRGDAWRAKASMIRIAQIPAGSTDAVACTINGCRSAVTAALHIVVGDRAQLDVLEVRTQEGHCRYACSTASYGFVGDVLDASESMRWMGPVRYDVSGAMTLMRLRSYPVRLWYKLPEAPHPVRKVCCSDCQICSQPRSNVFDAGDIVVNVSSESTTIDIEHTVRPEAEAYATDLTELCAKVDACDDRHVSCHSRSDAATAPSPTRTGNQHLHMRGASGFGEQAFLGNLQPPTSAADSTTTCDTDSAIKKDVSHEQPDDWFGDIGNVPACSADVTTHASGYWRCWEGEISSLMVVVTPTRSDKSKHGLVPHAHLSDGRLHLVIVRRCTRMQFLRFLVSLTRGGVDESLSFVDVKEVEAWRLEELVPSSRASVWNVDGELMQSRFMSARCHHGLIHVFGRGPEI